MLLAAELESHGVGVVTGASVSRIENEVVVLADGRRLEADVVVGSLGIRPDTRLAKLAGLRIGPNGGYSRRRLQPHERSGYIRRGRRRREAGQGRRRQLADRARQRREPTGATGRRQHLRDRAPTRSFGRHLDREGSRPHRRRHRLEREAVAGGGASVPGDSFPSPSPHGVLPRREVDVSQAPLRSPRRLHSRRTGGRRGGGRQADRRSRHGDRRRHHRRRLADLELAYSPPFSSAKDPINMLGYMAENVLRRV